MRIILLLAFFGSLSTFSQRNMKDSTRNNVLLGMNYKFNLVSGDIKKLWGYNHEIGISIDNKFKSNLTLGISAGFIFGNQFKDTSIFKPVVNDFGTVTSFNGTPAQVLFLMRGMTANINAGYVFNKLGNNPNSGLWLDVGVGMLMHKIRIESIYDDIPQLEGEYRKGYDRLHIGFQTREFIGYLFQGDSRFLNFYAGFEFIQGFTENQRNYNFDLEGPDPGLKFDFLWGAKVGWLIPIYKRAPKDYYID